MQLQMTGITPLLMHNVQTADPLNHFTKEIAKLTSKKKNMTEVDELEVGRLKFAAGLYYDSELGPYLPAPNIFRSLIDAGRATRDGKKIEMGVVFLTDKARLEYNGPRDIDALWGEGLTQFVDRRIVTVNRARVVGTRPIFPSWGATFDLEVDPEVIDPDQFAQIAERAGRSVGVGDYRRFYGRFTTKLLG